MATQLASAPEGNAALRAPEQCRRPARPRKRLVRRTDADHSQALRRGFQFVFLALNLWLGSQFYLWVRHFETGGRSPAVARPAGVEGYLPIAGLMNLKYWLLTGRVPPFTPPPCSW